MKITKQDLEDIFYLWRERAAAAEAKAMEQMAAKGLKLGCQARHHKTNEIYTVTEIRLTPQFIGVIGKPHKTTGIAPAHYLSLGGDIEIVDEKGRTK